VALSRWDGPGRVASGTGQETGLATVPLAHEFHQSKQNERPSYLDFKGPHQGHMGDGQRRAGDHRGNAASSSPPCWEVFVHRQPSTSSDSSNHDNVSSAVPGGLPQELTSFCTKSVSPFF